MRNKMSLEDGAQFEMGVSIHEVSEGDAIKVAPHRLEIISHIEPVPGSTWNKRITTKSGRTFTMTEVLAYGKRI